LYFKRDNSTGSGSTDEGKETWLCHNRLVTERADGVAIPSNPDIHKFRVRVRIGDLNRNILD